MKSCLQYFKSYSASSKHK